MRPRSPVGHHAGGAEVAGQQRPRDLDLAVGGDAHLRVRQGPARAAGTVRARQVQRLHRRAFGQAVALVGRDAACARGLDHARADRRPAHRDQLQRRRRAGIAVLQPGGPRAQHLRQQDHAVRCMPQQRRVEQRGVEAGGAREPHLRQRRHDHGRSARQRREHAGQVLQQHRQRQHAQVPPDVQRLERAHQPGGRTLHRRVVQAHALGRAGRARREGDLRGRRRHGHRAPRQFHQHQRPPGHLAGLLLRLRPGGREGGVRQQRVHAGRLQRVADLLRREEGRQRHVHHARIARGEVRDHPRRSVVHQRGQHPGAARLQRDGQARGRRIQFRAAPAQARAFERGQVRGLHAPPSRAAPARSASRRTAGWISPATTTGRWS